MIYTKGKVAYNFTLFKETPEFNALYQLLHVKTKTLYSEKFCPTVNSIVPILFCGKKQNKSE